MDYFAIIRSFWDDAPEIEGFKPDYAALFFAIADSVNRNLWKETEIEYDRIINKTKIGKRMYLAGREWLHVNNFITYIKGSNDYSRAKFNIAVRNCTATCTTSDTTTDTSTAPQVPISCPSTVPYLNKTLDFITNIPLDVVEEATTSKKIEDDVPHFVIENRNALLEEIRINPVSRTPPPTWSEMEMILSNADEMRNTACKNNGLTEDGYLIAVSRFIGDQKAKNKPVKSEGDVRSHFLYWLPKWEQIRKRELQSASDTGPPKGKIQQAIEGTRSAADELRRRRALNNN